MENLKLICIEKGTYKDKKGKERISKNFYLVFNDKYCSIKPSFANGYQFLELFSEKVEDDKE